MRTTGGRCSRRAPRKRTSTPLNFPEFAISCGCLSLLRVVLRGTSFLYQAEDGRSWGLEGVLDDNGFLVSHPVPPLSVRACEMCVEWCMGSTSVSVTCHWRGCLCAVMLWCAVNRGITINTGIFPAATDSRFLRVAGGARWGGGGGDVDPSAAEGPVG